MPAAELFNHTDGLKVLNENYYTMLFPNNIDKWEFKLLNGTKEEYSQISEIYEKTLTKEIA